MERLAGELSSALDRARTEGVRGRALGDLSGSIDLDEVLTRTLEAATSATGVDAAVVSVRGPGGEPVVAGLGVDALDAERDRAGDARPDGSRARAVRVSYVYEREGGLRSGLAVPLESDGEPLGSLAVYARGGVRPRRRGARRQLEELAASAGPAVDNARRFREARQLADMDALTGLHNRRYFHETLAREVARAQRYERALALVVLDLDDFKRSTTGSATSPATRVLAEAAERVRDVVRSATSPAGSAATSSRSSCPSRRSRTREGLYRRLGLAMAKRPARPGRDARALGRRRRAAAEDDAVSFFERADEALYRAKSAGKGTVAIAGPPEAPPAPPTDDSPHGPGHARPELTRETQKGRHAAAPSRHACRIRPLRLVERRVDLGDSPPPRRRRATLVSSAPGSPPNVSPSASRSIPSPSPAPISSSAASSSASVSGRV